MSIQLYSHNKGDLEKAVEIILTKANKITVSRTTASEELEDNLISQSEAAKFLKISLPTIIDWRKHKGLPHYNFHGRYYYSKRELLEYGKRKNQKQNGKAKA